MNTRLQASGWDRALYPGDQVCVDSGFGPKGRPGMTAELPR